MKHKRRCYQSQQFIKEIHGKNVGAGCNSQSNAIGYDIKGKENPFMIFMLHVLEGI